MKRKTVLLCMVLVLVGLISTAKYISSRRAASTSADQPIHLASIYASFKQSKKPSVIVFSYDAECCETTKAFFQDYNSKAKAFLEKQKNKLNTLFVNTGTMNEQQVSEFLEIAQETSMTEVPCVLLLDSSGKPVEIISGPFDAAAVSKAAEGLVR